MVKSPNNSKGGISIKTLYQLENLSDISISSEEEEDRPLTTTRAMEELDLDRTPLPKMVWTPTKYKPPASKKTSIKYNIAYRFNKQ